MKHLGLFEGIGGFSLAARWMGWETIAWVEIDKFCQKVLKKNFPNAKGYGDIKEFDGSAYRGTVDIITGGFPCQPFSVAGKRKGKEDDRHLWPEMFRVIREIKPRWIVGENVTGIIGMALDQVLSEMEGEGYNTETYIIPACAINAPHRRDRVWIIATNPNEGSGPEHELRTRRYMFEERHISNATDTQRQGLEIGELEPNGKEREAFIRSDYQWENWPTKPGICGGDDVVPNRVDRIKSLGNAIVPQVAYEIFKAIESVTHQN